jgi:Holliday junction resolvasome RuvABC endonuclease subunit
MRIPVVGFDPSMRGWGIAKGMLDLTTGILEIIKLEVIITKKVTSKQVRTNSLDLATAKILADAAREYGHWARVVFAEVPVGSQSAAGMKAYGMCVGILGMLQSEGVQIIEVTASEVKKALSDNENATKTEMVAAAMSLYPEANFPNERGRILKRAEHVADAIGAIHAGVRTPLFQAILKLYS